MMLIGELLMRPLLREVSERVEQYALELGVCDDMFAIARRLSEGSLGLALVDFQRSGYQGNWEFDDYAESLHTRKRLAQAWDENPNDPDLAARWAALEQCRAHTLGRMVYDFYEARGFVWPGLPGSAPPLLAQHDWCTCSPTSAARSSAKSRCSASSPGRTTTPKRSHSKRWC